MKITKALIPVAGLGTRLYPITKVIPKTMMPVGTRPVLEYIIHEAINSGINEFIIIINKNQQIIKDYFNNISSLKNKIKIKYIYQLEQKGLADEILTAEKYLQKEDFAVMLGDDLIIKENNTYGIGRLLKLYESTRGYYIGTKEVSIEKTKEYGIVKYNAEYILTDIIEKPKINPPSLNAICGRYILKNDIFNYIRNHKTNGEILLPNIFKEISREQNIKIVPIKDKCFDIGNVNGFIEANNYIQKKNKA